MRRTHRDVSASELGNGAPAIGPRQIKGPRVVASGAGCFHGTLRDGIAIAYSSEVMSDSGQRGGHVMLTRRNVLQTAAIWPWLASCQSPSLRESARAAKTAPATTSHAITGARWFTGEGFEARTGYSVAGRLTFRRPPAPTETLDLSGAWLIPPFAEAHNHNIGDGDEASMRRAIARYVADGVFYAKIQGNLPVSNELKTELGINRPQGIDAVFAQGLLTSSDGHPIALAENVLLPQGAFPGETRETLKDRRYFLIDSEMEFQSKWPQLLAEQPDFVKIVLSHSEDYSARKGAPSTSVGTDSIPSSSPASSSGRTHLA